MKKRCLAFCLCLAVMLCLFGGCEIGTASKSGNVFVDQEEYKELTAERSAVFLDEPPALYINGVKAVYETKKQYYFFSVSEAEEWELLTPTVEGYEAVYVSNFEDQSKTEFLSANRAVKLLLYTDTEYTSLSVMFTMLPLLAMETKQLPAEYQYHDHDEERKLYKDDEGEEIPCDLYEVPSDDPDAPISLYETFMEITLIDPLAAEHGYENGFTSLARAHIRGRSSRQYPKNSFKLELLQLDGNTLVERDVTMLGMRSDGDWNLNGMYAEPTKVRDKVATDLWLNITADREGVLSVGYKSEYVEMIINGQYFGLYLMTERIDRKQLDLQDGDRLYFAVGDLGKHHMDYYECENDDMEISGYSLDWPKERTEPYDEWVPFGDLCYVMDANTEIFKERAPALINVDSLADYEIFVQTAVGVDNVIQNTFLVANLQEDGSYEFTFIPWDMDQTFGNRWHGEEPLLTGEDHWSLTQWDAKFWIAEKMSFRNTEGYRDVVNARYNALRDTVISDKAIVDMINAEFDLLNHSGAYARNKTRWPDGGYTDSVDDTNDFLIERFRWLDTQYPD